MSKIFRFERLNHSDAKDVLKNFLANIVIKDTVDWSDYEAVFESGRLPVSLALKSLILEDSRTQTAWFPKPGIRTARFQTRHGSRVVAGKIKEHTDSDYNNVTLDSYTRPLIVKPTFKKLGLLLQNDDYTNAQAIVRYPLSVSGKYDGNYGIGTVSPQTRTHAHQTYHELSIEDKIATTPEALQTLLRLAVPSEQYISEQLRGFLSVSQSLVQSLLDTSE